MGKVRESAITYADEAVPAILKDWSAAELNRRSAAELRANADPKQMGKMLSDLKAKLGAYQSSEKGQMGNFEAPGTNNTGGPFMVAQVTKAATFEKGKAVVDVKLIRREGKWQVANFFVQADPGK